MLFKIFNKLDLIFTQFNPSAIWFYFYDLYFSFFWRTYLVSSLPQALLSCVLYFYNLGLTFINYLDSLFYPIAFFFNEYTISAFIYALKFLCFIAILIFVRGGIPRYRFDYLTKLGWMKFLSLILLFFLFEFLLLILC